MIRSTVLFVLLVFIFSSSSYSQDTIYTEDFSQGFNSNWKTYIDTSMNDKPVWEWRGPDTEPYNVYYPLDGACNYMGEDVDDLPFESQLNGYMAFDGNMWDMGTSDSSPCFPGFHSRGDKPGPYMSYLESPNFDLSLLDKPVLSCRMLARSYQMYLYFEYSLDDGNTWHRGVDLIEVYGNDIEGEVQVNLKPFAANKNRFRFRFLFSNYHVLLDDLVIKNQHYAVPQIFEVWKNPVRPVYDLDFYQMPKAHLKSLKPGMTISVEANEDIEVSGILKVYSPSSFQSFKKSFNINVDSSLKELIVEFDEYPIEHIGEYNFVFELRVNGIRVLNKRREEFEVTESLFSPAGLNKELTPHNYNKRDESEQYQSFKPKAIDTIFGIEFAIFNASELIEYFDLQTYEGDEIKLTVYEVENLESYKYYLEELSHETLNYLSEVASKEFEVTSSMLGIDEFIKSRVYFDEPIVVDTSKLYVYSIFKKEGIYLMPIFSVNQGSNSDFSSFNYGHDWRIYGSVDEIIALNDINNYLKLLLGESRVGIKKNKLNKLSVFPNPAKEEISIRSNSGKGIEKIEIYHSDGRIIQSFNLDNNLHSTISLNELQSGNYILKVQFNQGGLGQQFFVKQ